MEEKNRLFISLRIFFRNRFFIENYQVSGILEKYLFSQIYYLDTFSKCLKKALFMDLNSHTEKISSINFTQFLSKVRTYGQVVV